MGKGIWRSRRREGYGKGMWARQQKCTVPHKGEMRTLVQSMRIKCYELHIIVSSTLLLNSNETRKGVLNSFLIARLERILVKQNKTKQR